MWIKEETDEIKRFYLKWLLNKKLYFCENIFRNIEHACFILEDLWIKYFSREYFQVSKEIFHIWKSSVRLFYKQIIHVNTAVKMQKAFPFLTFTCM